MTKPNRNDACPCGSGKKYKKCCWEKDQSKGFDAKLIGGSNPVGSLFDRIVKAEPKKADEKKD